MKKHMVGLSLTFSATLAACFIAACSGGDDTADGGTDATSGTDTGTKTDTGTGTDSGKDAGSDAVADTGSDTGTGTDASTFDAASITLDCTSYCNGIDTICGSSGLYGQYLNVSTCIAMCSKLPVGDGGEVTGNTLGCRVYHTKAAASDKDTHCKHAGPFGFGGCGSECENFCNLYAAHCGTYGGTACVGQCGGFSNPDGGFLFATGNTIDCREYHLENAYNAGDGGGGHCAHANSDGGGVCQ